MMTCGPVVIASTLSAPPQCGQTVTSMSYTRRSRCIEVIADCDARAFDSHVALGMCTRFHHQQRAMTRVGCEQTVIADEMRLWARHQGCQAG